MSKLSKRATARFGSITTLSPLPRPSGPYYDSTLHPDGVINLSTAENSLLTDELVPIFHEARLRAQHLKYRTTLLRSAVPQLADLLPRYVNMVNPVRPITRENSVPGPGIGALLANLIWTLCDEGDGVLLSAPYYHDYDRDIMYPGKAVPVLAHVPADIDSQSSAVLLILRERIRTSAARDGVPIRCLILCNPHNPIPQCYPLETIQGYIDIAREFDLHLIVDEIFANTTFPTTRNPSPIPFISVLSLDVWDASSQLLNQIHVLAGPTKDFGCSALKAGLLVTENAAVRQSVATALQATPISGAADAMLSALLIDEARTKALLEKNRAAQGRSFDLCADWAHVHGLPYVPANAGVYFILDLSPVVLRLGLGEGDNATAELMRRMIVNKVHINPTALDLDPLPHRFRFIFTHEPAVLTLALGRLEKAFALTS